MPTDATTSPVTFDRRLKVAIVTFTAAVLVALGGLRAYDLWQRREAVLLSGERKAGNIALIAATQMRAAFAAADATLRQLTLYNRQIGGPSAAPEQWQPMLEFSRTRRNGLGSLSVTDARGIIRHSTLEEIIGSPRNDTHLFRQLATVDRDILEADTPFRPPLAPHLMLIPLGRRLTTATGEFQGVVVATFLPEQIRDVYQQLDIGREGQIAVFHPAGYVMFRVPAEKDPIGQSAVGDRLFNQARTLTEPTISRLPARDDHPAAIAAFQSTGEPTLHIAVSLSERELLAEWRRDVGMSAALIAAIGLVLALLVRLVFRQLDARAAAEAALARGQRLDALGQLTGGVAHDFNNLLTVIMMNISVLKLPGGAGAPGSRDTEAIEQIENAARRAAALTRQLLTLARRQPLQAKLLDLNLLARELQPLLARLLGEDITVKLSLTPEPCLARVDRVQLEIALINLCVNARDAMPKGGLVAIHSDVVGADDLGPAAPTAEAASGRYVRLSVSDNGSGIPAEHLSRIFEPFFTTKPVGKGTGLGLSMVHGFVRQSGGDVKIFSEPGSGTVVRMYFPYVAGVPHVPPATPPPLRGAKSEGEVILLLEDEPLVRRLAEFMLRKLGYDVVSATSGPEALERARELPKIDLLLTDVILPGGMNGREVAEALAAERPGLRVLFASGYSPDLLRERSEFGGAELRIITKPYDIHTLAEAARAAMDEEVAVKSQ